MLNIIARKPKDDQGNEYVVVDRGEDLTLGRYVSATANAHSLHSDEWFWGHYFDSRIEALEHFGNRLSHG